MKHISEIIDDILVEWSYRVHDGMPNPENPLHLVHLEDTLNELRLPRKVAVKVLEKVRKYKDNKMNKDLGRVGEPWGSDAKDVSSKGVDPDEFDDDEIASMQQSNPDEFEKAEPSPLVSGMRKEQQKTSVDRDKGIAGAGGQAASQGESRYSNAVDNLDYGEFNKRNKKEIDTEVQRRKSDVVKKTGQPKTTVSELKDLKAMGLEPGSDEAWEYLATREVFAQQEFDRIDKMEKPNVFTNSDGFDKSEKGYKDWMRAAFDGALATQQLLGKSRMDTSKPHVTIQSTKEVDNKVETDIQSKRDAAKPGSDEYKHYDKELKSFQKFRKYHDTYVVGVDKNGRSFVVHVSNKKDSGLNDPQNNTTPAQRFDLIKESFGPKVAKTVTTVMDESIKKVTSVQNQTRKSSVKVDIDDDFAILATAATGKRIKEVDTRATKVDKKTGKAPRYKGGKPVKGSELACYIEDKGISTKDWGKYSTAKKLQVMQQYMGDDKWAMDNGTKNEDGSVTPLPVGYDPYSKIFIKVGEAMSGGRGFSEAFWKKNPKAAAARSSKGAQQSDAIKQSEATAVNEAHNAVVKTITEADAPKYPIKNKAGEVVDNGPHTEAYIGTVMGAMHYDTYIDMDDDDDDKMIVQMGINGAKPSHIRNCLAEKSGYDLKKGDREGLKKHLRERCTVEVDPEGKKTGAIVITGKNGDVKTRIAEDTWRTAGTSQKVASGFGEDLKKCIAGKVATDRDGIQ